MSQSFKAAHQGALIVEELDLIARHLFCLMALAQRPTQDEEEVAYGD